MHKADFFGGQDLENKSWPLFYGVQDNTENGKENLSFLCFGRAAFPNTEKRFA